MLMYSRQGTKLVLSLGRRTKLCALALYPVFLSSGSSLYSTWWGLLRMAWTIFGQPYSLSSESL